MPRVPSTSVLTLAFPVGVLPPHRVRSLPTLLALYRLSDGQFAATCFPNEIDASEQIVARLDPHLVHLEHGRLYVSAANGNGVYFPIGDSSVRGCVRCGRLYLRRLDGGG